MQTMDDFEADEHANLDYEQEDPHMEVHDGGVPYPEVPAPEEGQLPDENVPDDVDPRHADLTVAQEHGNRLTSYAVKLTRAKGPQGCAPLRVKEATKFVKERNVPGILNLTKLGTRNDVVLMLLFTNRETCEHFVNTYTFSGLLAIGTVKYSVLLGTPHAAMSTVDARDIELNENGGPAGFGYPSYSTDVATTVSEMIDEHYTWGEHSDVKAIFRSPAQFDSSTNVTQGARVFWYSAIPGKSASDAALNLPHVMKLPGTTRIQRGKTVATFFILKHFSLTCATCNKIGHAALAPICKEAPGTLMDRQPNRRRPREQDPNMLCRNVRPRVA